MRLLVFSYLVMIARHVGVPWSKITTVSLLVMLCEAALFVWAALKHKP